MSKKYFRWRARPQVRRCSLKFFWEKIHCTKLLITPVYKIIAFSPTWTLTKRTEKKLDGKCPRRLRAISNKSWKQYSTKQQLYRHKPPISKCIQIRRTRNAGHCWRSDDDLISNVLQRTPIRGRASVG